MKKIWELLNDKKIIYSLIVVGLLVLLIICGAIIFYNGNTAYQNGKLDQATERAYTDATETNRKLEQTNKELSDIFEEIRKQKRSEN